MSHFPRLNCQFTVIGIFGDWLLSVHLSVSPSIHLSVTNSTRKQNNRDCEYSNEYCKMKQLALHVMMHYVFVSGLFRLKKTTPALSHSLTLSVSSEPNRSRQMSALWVPRCALRSQRLFLCATVATGAYSRLDAEVAPKSRGWSPPSLEDQVTQLGDHFFFFLGAGAKWIKFDLVWQMNNRL